MKMQMMVFSFRVVFVSAVIQIIMRGEPMRAIDGDHLRRWILSRVFQTQLSIADVIDQIDREDTIEPERKKGKWTKDNACEFCGFKPWYEGDIHTLSYCPNCGADMREVTT